MAAIIWALVRPILGYLIGIVAVISLLTGVYFKIKHDAVVAEKAQIEKEKENAIEKATQARARVQMLCSGAVPNCPAEWFRDN